MKQSCRMPRIVRALALVGALSLASSRSEATMLNLVSGPPDFLASPVTNVTCSATGHFLATGYTTDYLGGTVTLTDVGDYTLDAWFTSAGVLTNGTLTIMGGVDGGLVETLLSGTLNTGADGTAYGCTNLVGNSIFEFKFTVSGGNSDVVDDFGGLGAANRGVILTMYYEESDTQFGGGWGSYFGSSSASSVADNFVAVPEPSSLLLVLVAGGLCAMLRVRHKRV